LLENEWRNKQIEKIQKLATSMIEKLQLPEIF
jgi:hypothetical protein